MKRTEDNAENIKPDLKHDTMEYSASTDGDDLLRADLPGEEEDEISAEELDFLETGSLDEQAAALNNVEMDRKADDDVIFDENDVEEEEASEDSDEDNDVNRRDH